MRGDELLDKTELDDPAYVEAAAEKPAKHRVSWVKWGGLPRASRRGPGRGFPAVGTGAFDLYECWIEEDMVLVPL